MWAPSRRSRLSCAFLVVALVAALAGTSPAGSAAVPPSGGAGLGRHDRELLAQARGAGSSTVTLLIATRLGATRAWASSSRS